MKLNNLKLQKRKDGRWQYYYYENNKKCYLYARTQLELYNKAINKLDELAELNNTHKVSRNRELTLDEWVKQWIEFYKVPYNKTSTLEKDVRTLNKYLPKKFKDKSIKAIKSIDVLEVVSSIELSRTRQYVFVLLKSAFQKAVDNDIIKKNPCSTLPTPKHIKEEKFALTTDEEEKLLPFIEKSKYSEIIKIMLYAGLRIGEVLALRFNSIQDNLIIVSETKTDYDIGKTKNSKTRRVPIFKELEFLKEKKGSSLDLLYQVKRNAINDELVILCNHANIRKISPHCLRHTFATRCAEKNIVAKQVQLWLGHSDISVTLKYYTNINPEFESQNIYIKNN